MILPVDFSTRGTSKRSCLSTRRLRSPSLAWSALLVALAATFAAAAQSDVAQRTAIHALVAGAESPGTRRPDFSGDRAQVDRFYARGDYAPVWFAQGRARADVALAIDELRGASSHGLAAEDYDVEWLVREIRDVENDASPERVARADVAVTVAVFRYLSDLHFGRVRPSYADFHYPSKNEQFKVDELVLGALASHRLDAAITAAEPSFPIYLRLKDLLSRYRALTAQPWPPLAPLPAKSKKIEAGNSYVGLATLRERLVVLGDLPTDAPGATVDRYAGVLVDAVRRFQDRHGLAADGVLGDQTLHELNVPPFYRVRQIELALERLRWLPDLPRGPLIAVNIPSYKLWALSDGPYSAQAALDMRVIVGRAMRTETPVFIGQMRHVEFSPYWNVPPSIQRNEIVPRLLRDPSYLQREDMELVSTGAEATATTIVNEQTLAGLRSGKLRVRQRPGPKNALDGVKFVLPNTANVYLHGTPARELFERTRRDFSHGCIRVADPVRLAQFVLHDQSDWTEERIRDAMSAGQTRTVHLSAPIPVLIFYTTAIVGSDGRAIFLHDAYGYDAKLQEALRASRPPRGEPGISRAGR